MTDVQCNSIHLLHPKWINKSRDLTLFIQSGARLNFEVTLFANGTFYHNGKRRKKKKRLWNKKLQYQSPLSYYKDIDIERHH